MAVNDEEIVLFRLDGPNGSHDVMLWPGYGVVMPSRFTSNGSPSSVARAVMAMILDWGYEVGAVEMEPDTSSVEALFEQLRARMAAKEKDNGA